MRQKRQREVWSALGGVDADWAVLTERGRRGGGWNQRLSEFYASGRASVDEALQLAQPPGFTKALDFGAGTGRLSLALAERFAAVTALDVSDGMLSTLRRRVEERGVVNISPTHVDEFVPAGDHDFAISLLVLQHLPDHDAVARALATIAASLRPGGVAVIEVPERALLLRARVQPRLRVYAFLRSAGVPAARLHRLGFSGISMLTIDDRSMTNMLDSRGLAVIERISRPDRDYDYARWAVRKGK